MTPVSELPFNIRPKSRKEKNKLASRACRLKKKAQHEANKIKLFGLETEHSRFFCFGRLSPLSNNYNFYIIYYFHYIERLINGIMDIKRALAYKCGRVAENTEEINRQIDGVAASATSKFNACQLLWP